MGDPVVHFEIIGKDPAALRAFYRDSFGWEIGAATTGANIPDYALVRTAGKAGIDGGIGVAPAGYDGHVTFYIGVADIAAALERVRQCGGTPMMAPQTVPGGYTIALFEDPEGHVIGLRQNPAGPAPRATVTP